MKQQAAHIIELSYATIDPVTEAITWKPGEFTPKRQAAIRKAFTMPVIIPAELERIA